VYRRSLNREITARAADRRCEDGMKEEPGVGRAPFAQSGARFSIDFSSDSCSHTRKHARARTKCAYNSRIPQLASLTS
jgi:hypothetical protein